MERAPVTLSTLGPPVLEPERERLRARPREPARSPAPTLGEGVAPPRHVRDREVREVDLVGGEAETLGRRPGGEPAAEERELVAEVPAARIRQVARVVPPLGLVVEVRAVVRG